MSFTPGPLKASTYNGQPTVFVGNSTTPVATCWDYPLHGTAKGNADLFAAAPDMYAALEAIEEWFASEDAGPTYPEGVTRDDGGEAFWRGWWQSNMELCTRANLLRKAALAKARGEA